MLLDQQIAKIPQIVIRPSERVLILGKTGSGKTVFAKHMLSKIEGRMRIVIVDPKEDWLLDASKWAKGRNKGSILAPRLVRKFNPGYLVQCIQPDEHEDIHFAAFCMSALKMRNTFFYFDETEGIATANFVPFHIRRIWKTGRSLNIGAWVSSQVPSGIPRLFKSQAEKFFVFKVGEEDIDLAAKLAHVSQAEIQALANYEYFYYDSGTMDKGVKMPPVPFVRRVSRV